MMVAWIILAILVVGALYGIVLYNRLVKNRQMVHEGWSGIRSWCGFGGTSCATAPLRTS